MNKTTLLIDGENLTADVFVALGKGKYHIDLSPDSWKKVEQSRKVVDEIVASDAVVYGINTGFGSFSSVVIAREELKILQENLIRSHAAGVGDVLDLEGTRRLIVARVNTLAKGYSGISRETLEGVIRIFNSDCLSMVPVQGTLGASGDLAQLAHLTLGFIGEGMMWNPQTNSYEEAAKVLVQNNLHPLELKPKEGLALINGTQFIVSIGMEVFVRARNLTSLADYICALTIESLRGSARAFYPKIHQTRPHRGQIQSAKNILSCLESEASPSQIMNSHKDCNRVQDAYSLRCAPQVHGVAHEVVEFSRRILETELNSATDNPMVFVSGDSGEILSCGNFHGEYPSKTLDFLAIAICELGSISERRIERLMNDCLSDLPAFLVHHGGLNSGFMLAHCTAAALLSENKGLCHPASIDSISTSAAKEDHVSMGGWAARKALQVIKNVEVILAIELMCATQAIDFLRPLTSTPVLESLHHLVRQKIPHWDKDRFMKPDIEMVTELIRDGSVLSTIRNHLEKPHVIFFLF
eukprot:TRINITY_DN3427_c0_g1_i9.p1 TRINITY_DN3427_c0_g1~~TRINITY_DN3427_c0_g1_i9.p1  ORF type:complete len:526 (-),score=109.40 TRINITY_DN3427_c0_g1_i9:401-1978(-)